MYKLNNNEISESKASELIADLAMFPYESDDLKFDVQSREEQYHKELKEKKRIKLSDSLVLSIE